MEEIKGSLIKLPKKGDLSYCNMASKVFCRVILERIKTALDEKLKEERAGFRAGRSCTDQIATLRIIVELSIEWQSSLNINSGALSGPKDRRAEPHTRRKINRPMLLVFRGHCG